MALQIHIVTAFPKLVEDALSYSISGRAIKRNLVEITAHDLRTYADDKHRTIDDTPYGGGGGMILKAEPIFKCLESVLKLSAIGRDDHIRNRIGTGTEIIMMSPQGETFTQKKAVELSLKQQLVFICGHYKGVDERVQDKLVTQTISIGDYVCSGGELPVLTIADAIIRLLPGALNDAQSALSDSFQEEVLDCPYYTRPEDFRGMKVPQELVSGNHAAIEQWRAEKKIENTKKLRPDLWDREKDK
jgi:tRNA (guanine37-N1)-methyltransferase